MRDLQATFRVLGMGLATLLTAVGANAATLPAVGSGTLVIRLDAQTGVTTDGLGNVTSWVDQTGGDDNAGGANFDYGGTFTVPGVSTAPTLVSNVINGRPVVRFTGASNTALRGDTTPAPGLDGSDTHLDYTLFFVTINTTQPQGLLDTAPGVPNPLRFLSPNRFANQSNDNAGIPVTLTPGSAPGSSGGTIFIGIHDGDVGTNSRTWAGFVNGSSYPGSTNFEGINSARRVAFRTTQLGATNDNLNPFTGDLAELLVYQGVLSAADRLAVQDYLNEKYAVIPEPAGIGLLALGGLMLRRRR